MKQLSFAGIIVIVLLLVVGCANGNNHAAIGTTGSQIESSASGDSTNPNGSDMPTSSTETADIATPNTTDPDTATSNNADQDTDTNTATSNTADPDIAAPDTATPDTATSNTTAPDTPTTDKPTTDKPTTDKPTTDKPTTDKPTSTLPSSDKAGLTGTQKSSAGKPSATPSAKPDTKTEVPDKTSITLSIIGNEEWGEVLAAEEIVLSKGDKPVDVLIRAAKAHRLAYEVRGSGALTYIEGIDGLYEFEDGPTSGWKFRVNGKVSSVGAGVYELKAGDRLEWFYGSDDNTAEEDKEYTS